MALNITEQCNHFVLPPSWNQTTRVFSIQMLLKIIRIIFIIQWLLNCEQSSKWSCSYRWRTIIIEKKITKCRTNLLLGESLIQSRLHAKQIEKIHLPKIQFTFLVACTPLLQYSAWIFMFNYERNKLFCLLVNAQLIVQHIHPITRV